MLYATFPEVLAGLPRGSVPRPGGLVVVLVSHAQHEVFAFEVDLRDAWPEVVANLNNALIVNNANFYVIQFF